MHNNRRSKIHIVGDILRLGEATKTQVMYGLGFNSRRADEYIDWLVKLEFLEALKNGHRTIYRTTERGKGLLEKIDRVSKLLE